MMMVMTVLHADCQDEAWLNLMAMATEVPLQRLWPL